MDKYEIMLKNRVMKCDCTILLTTSQKVAKKIVAEINGNKGSVFGVCEDCPLSDEHCAYKRGEDIPACEACSIKIKE